MLIDAVSTYKAIDYQIHHNSISLIVQLFLATSLTYANRAAASVALSLL